MLIFLSFLMAVSFVVLLVFGIFKKIYMGIKEKRIAAGIFAVKEKIDTLLNAADEDFLDSLDEFAWEACGKDIKNREKLDEYLLNTLELSGTANRDRIKTIARKLGFPAECLEQIKSGKSRMIAHGSRRAGLYNFEEAAEEMVSALEILSTENQFEILMGLARMGAADAMQRAFKKIKDNVIVSERAVIDILSSFPQGEEKVNLFRTMIHGETNYITALFLKAVDKNMAKALRDDIVSVLHDGNKEIRTAALRGLATLECEAPEAELINLLEDQDWEVRALAAKALGFIKNEDASFALFKAINDQQWWVRQNVVSALSKHHGYETLFVLASEMGDEYTRDSIMSTLENSGSPLLLRSLKIMKV